MEGSDSGPPVPLDKRLAVVRAAALGRGEGLTVHSSLSKAHYDTLVDCLLALYEECSSPRLSKDRQVARFVDKYKGVVQELRSLRVNVDDFVLKGVVGRGHFGEVRVVSERGSGRILAMKVMKKEDILKQADAAFFQEERDIMAWNCSTWLTSLVYAFQDPLCLYLVMEFHVGGDLLGVMERSPEILDEQGVQFYLAEVAAGLNDLHQLGFVHRDVKPENVLISATGHIKLVDFGSAARLTGGLVTSAALPVGTPEYIAPEVLTSLDSPSPCHTLSVQYGVCCDWWSLGIIGYELLVGVTPFEGDTTAQTYANIMAFRKGVHFPEEVELSPKVKDLLVHLLSPQDERLGFEGIKQHDFFQQVPWSSLHSMPPPLVPKASGQDDTSNFEPPEPSNRPALPAVCHGNRTSGFSGKELPFIGFTFTRTLGSFPGGEQMEPVKGSVVRSLSSETFLFESTLETSEAELSAMISEVKQILMSREETLSKVEESHRVLQQEQVIKQSELEELQRALQIERSERQSTEARTLQLLAEVREYHNKIADLKDAKSRESIGQYQKALVLAEQEQKDAGVRAEALQGALKQQMKETEQANSRVTQLQKKVAELKEGKRKDLVAMQNKIMQTFKESENKTKDLQERLNATVREKEVLEGRVREMETEQAAKREAEWRIRETESMEEQKKSAGAEQLTAELAKAGEAAQVLEEAKADLLEKVAQWKERVSKGESELRELRFTLQQQMSEKTATQQAHQEEVSCLKAELQVLENRLKSCEPAKKKGASMKDRESETSQALQAKVECLEVEKSSLEVQLSNVKKQASDSAKDALSLKELLEKEREAASEVRQKVQKQRDTIKHLENTAEQLKKHLQSVKENSSKGIKEVVDLKQKLSAQEGTIKELTADNQSLERRVAVLKEAHGVARAESCKVQESECQLRHQLQACMLKSDIAEEQLKAATSQLEDLQVLCKEWSSREAKWSEDKEALQTELGVVQSRLEETSALLEKERALRVEVEEQNDRSLAMFQKSATVHSEEVKCFQENLFRQKRLAEQYSQRITELEQGKAGLEAELLDVRTRMERAMQEASTASGELSETRRELNILKASHLKLTKAAEEQSTEVQQLAAAGQAQQEQLQELLGAKEEQEYRLQTTIAQQSKLIELAMQSRTPTKGTSITKRLKKIIRRGRDPEREVEEWRALKGIIQSKPSPSAASSSTNTPTRSIGRSGSFLKKFRKSPGVVSQDSMTTGDSASIASSLPVSPQSKYHLRKPPRSSSSVALPSLSGSYSSVQSEMGTGSSSEDGTGTDVHAGVKRSPPAPVTVHKRSPPAPVTVHKRSPPAPVTVHNIPHKFCSQLALLHSAKVKCSLCKASLQRGSRYSKCTYCKNMYHMKCAKLVPSNCGLPPSLAEYTDDTPPPKRIKGDKVMSSSSDEADKPCTPSLQQGWVYLYSARGGTGREITQRWAVLTTDAVKLFTTELAVRRERPLMVYHLTVPTLLEACPMPQVLPPVLQSKAGQCFILRHTGGPYSQPLLLMSEEKEQWTAALSRVLGSSSSPSAGCKLKEFSISLDPLDLSRRSNGTELSISSDMFSEVL